MTTTATTSTATICPPLSSISSSSNYTLRRCTRLWPVSAKSIHLAIRRHRYVSCEVALKSDAPLAAAASSEEEEISNSARIGARVRVKASPQLMVYHVPKLPELDIAGMEGELKQYVGFWKGKQISANFPYKIEFYTEVEGRGRVKFFAHLREDEFEYIQ